MAERADGGRGIGAAVPERERLLGLAAEYVLEHGIADLTLRRLGSAIGSNNRMLLYYFGSKEQLISQALLAASYRFPTFAAALSGLDGPGALADRLDACWAAIAAPENRPFVTLFFEVFGVAAHRPGRFDEFLTRVGNDWTNDVARSLRTEGLPASAAPPMARELVALWRGLQFDLLSTGDAETVAASHTVAARAFAERCARLGAGTQPVR
ncbi:MAG: TetR/AcrR family transcriptional regulator [Pseudonocardia sp.]|nr:TetR/AcrR family transcriptional regulator [Pseudonocardia sp.]